MVATGQFCPVITAAKNIEETEKRLGSILLGAIPIFSLDNCTYDLEGELLCQLTERPVVNVRVLGRSEMPSCECRATVFATGNNIMFRGDMGAADWSATSKRAMSGRSCGFFRGTRSRLPVITAAPMSRPRSRSCVPISRPAPRRCAVHLAAMQPGRP